LQYDEYVTKYYEIHFLTAVYCLAGSCEYGREPLGSVKDGIALLAE
jgi:hypothetical protein